jgi:CelD/BcsL family acetyltransferase involved in cellulose biosynthesis
VSTLPERLEVEEISTTAGLAALEPEWWELWRASPAATPFQSPAWLLPWWRRFGTPDLLTLAVRRARRLIGLLPLYLYRDGAVRKLLPVGIGISDYLDPLLDADGCAAAMAHLGRWAHRFDRADLENQRPGSPLLQAKLPPPWRGDAHPGPCCPVLKLPAGRETLARAIPRMAKLPYYGRRAARLGMVERVEATADNLPGLLDGMFTLHAARWATRGGPGVLADPAVRAFHCDTAPLLLAHDLLRLSGLRLDGRLVAVLYGLADGRRLHAYLGGYDPALPHPGLGAMMLGRAIAAAVDEGLGELHFLRGREPYKYAWGAVDQPTWGLRLQPSAAEVERAPVP